MVVTPLSQASAALAPTIMKKTESSRNNSTKTKVALFAGTAALFTLTHQTQAQTVNSDPLIDKLEQKGILSADEAKELRSESLTDQTNLVDSIPASKWKIADSIKSIQLYGDFRLRYEYRGVDNVPGPANRTYYRERFRYALRFGIRGDLFDDFSYGLRLETATNPRSPWATFGSNTTSGSATPSDKGASGIGVGQAFIGWHPTSWYEMTVGRMPMPIYTTPMVWDSDINPEGAFEKFKLTIDNVDLFADFAQFDYQDPNPASDFPSSDTFIFAWQAGAVVKLPKDMSVKVAPMLYTYSGIATSGNGLNQPFVGQGNSAGANPGVPGAAAADLTPGPTDYNSDGIDNLLVMEIPAEFDFKIPHTIVGDLQARIFGDFAFNFEGNNRAGAAYNANPTAFPGLHGPVDGQNMAYQAGVGFGSAGSVYGPTQGLVYGSYAKKNNWEARFYWQHIEQYALDVNLIDSDFFEGRANLQGVYAAFAYSFTDAIIGTVRYGYASRINSTLGTGGNNLDIPGINPINNYNLWQMDLTWRF
jgi:hypothetical protein